MADALAARTGSDVEVSRQMQALVHATLEMAEQQRIANLIAYGNMRADVLNGEPALPSLRKQWRGAHRQILDGLDL